MNKDYEFTIGQRVRIYDVDFEENVYGTVVDKTSAVVIIKWDDLHDPTTHERFEFDEIKLSR